MADSKTVFISQGEAGVAEEIDLLIEKSFDGRIRTFNTSRYSRGLSAGDRLDPALREALAHADVVLSIWSPHSVASPAWMAWELGVAAAVDPAQPVLVARALGVAIDELPLDLPGRYAPDLGDEDQALQFLRDIARLTGVELTESDFRAAYSRHRQDGRPSPLHARRATRARVSIGHFKKRGLIENLSADHLREIDVMPLSGDTYAREMSQNIRETLAAQTGQAPGENVVGLRLLPHERLVGGPPLSWTGGG